MKWASRFSVSVLALLLCAAPLAAQPCYVQLDDATGLPLPPAQLAELEAAACELRAAFPAEFQGDFAVYDFGFYLHQERYEGGVPGVFQAKVAEVEQESAYFLLFGRQLSRGGVTSEVWVEVRLPEGEAYPCLRDAYQSGLIASHVRSKVAEALGQGLQPSAHAIALAGLSSLTHLVDKSVNCCSSPQGARAATGCTDCWFGGSSAEAEYARLLEIYGYLEYTGVAVAIEALETPYTGALKSGYEISLSRPGMQLSLTAETDAFLGGLPNPSALGRVDVYHYDENNCWQLDQFLQSGLARLDTTSLAYEENIIILAFGGELRVFYKFAVGADYGLETLKGGVPSSRQAVVLPAIAGWVLKKAAMAGTGVLMHVGITLAFEKWFGEYDTWGEAWDKSSFTAWELFYAAASGALAEHIVLQFFGDIVNGMVGYVLNTPTSSFSWEGFFAGGVVTGLADGVLGLLTGGILGDLSNKGKAIFQKYAPNINLTPGGPGGGDPWYRTLKELMGLVPTFMAKPKTFGAWKVVKKAKLPEQIRKNPIDLEKIGAYLKSSGKSVDDLASELAGNAKTASGSSRAWIDVIPSGGGSIVGYKGNYTQRESGEVFYRSISQSDYNELLATGRMPRTSETSTSPTQAFAESYDGVLVKYYVKTGTIDQLRTKGRTDGSSLVASQFGDMPQASSGWIHGFVRFKKEGTQVNIQLGRGPGIQIFNDNLIAFERIGL